MASIAQARPSVQQTPIVKVAVQSSFIAGFEYDQANLTLTTHLKSGAIYQHKFVTPGDFNLLQTSKNPSKHWSQAIKGKKASVRVKISKAPNSEIRKGDKK